MTSTFVIKTCNSTSFSNSNDKYWVGKTNHNTRGEFIVFKPGGGKYETK